MIYIVRFYRPAEANPVKLPLLLNTDTDVTSSQTCECTREVRSSHWYNSGNVSFKEDRKRKQTVKQQWCTERERPRDQLNEWHHCRESRTKREESCRVSMPGRHHGKPQQQGLPAEIGLSEVDVQQRPSAILHQLWCFKERPSLNPHRTRSQTGRVSDDVQGACLNNSWSLSVHPPKCKNNGTL